MDARVAGYDTIKDDENGATNPACVSKCQRFRKHTKTKQYSDRIEELE